MCKSSQVVSQFALAVGLGALMQAGSLEAQQPKGQMRVWHRGVAMSDSIEWVYANRVRETGPTTTTVHVATGDTVCVVVPNSHPIFYQYSTKAETLKVLDVLPAAPLLLALGLGETSKTGAPPRASWFQQYADNLDGLAKRINEARELAKASDAPEPAGSTVSSYKAASDAIKKLFEPIPGAEAGEKVEQTLTRWYTAAEKALNNSVQQLPKPPVLVTLPEVRSAAGRLLRSAADSNATLLKQAFEEVKNQLMVAQTGDRSLLSALKAYADALLATQRSISATWNGTGAEFRSCFAVGKEPMVIRTSATVKDSSLGKLRKAGQLAWFTIVPRYQEEVVSLTPMFTLSLNREGEPDYQVRDNAVVNLGDPDQIGVRSAVLLSFLIRQWREDGSIVWRVGLGSNVNTETDKLNRLFGSLSVGYRDVFGIGLGIGRVKRQRLSDSSILGKPLPDGKTLKDFLTESETRTAFYLTINLSGVDVLDALGALRSLSSK